MAYKGTVKGNSIELDEALPFVSGTRVEVSVAPECRPPTGSPKAILRLAGSLTEQEAEAIQKGADDCRRVDPRLWTFPA